MIAALPVAHRPQAGSARAATSSWSRSRPPSFDLGLEWYFQPGAVAGVSLFRKNVDNFTLPGGARHAHGHQR